MPEDTTPRLAGIRPKLRPSVILPAMTIASPTTEKATVNTCGRSGATWAGWSSGGASIDSVVSSRARTLRSTAAAERRITVSTTTSISLSSSRSPVKRPVFRKSAPNRTAIIENSTMIAARAAMSANRSASSRDALRSNGAETVRASRFNCLIPVMPFLRGSSCRRPSREVRV